MVFLAILAGLSFLVVGAVVGVRMLLLARRTRGTPELLLGAGLCSLIFVTLPCVALGLGLKIGPLWLQKSLFVAGLVPTLGFAVAIHTFTARVFRPASRIAWSAVLLAGLVTAAGLAGTVAARLAAWQTDRVVGPQWNVLLIVAFVAGFVWTAVESLRYHAKLRRRLALGLADPVVCNRFFLWGFGAASAVAGTFLVAFSLLMGWRLVTHPVPVLGLCFSGFSLSLSWWLAFVPPPAYLIRVRARAAA